MPNPSKSERAAALAISCKRHGSKPGERCNVRTAACAYRVTLSHACPRCGKAAGLDCTNLSSRHWQGWPPSPHRERRDLQCP